MARDKNEKMWIAGGAVSALALAGALWTFVVSPQMDDVTSLHSQTADAQTQNVALQANVSKLREQYTHISVVKHELDGAQAQLPSTSGLSELTAQLTAQAAAHHVSITQLTAAAPALVAPPSSTNTAAAPSPASSTAAAPAAAGASANPAGQLYAIQISVAVTGSQADELAFAKDVQQKGPRSALIGSVVVQNGDGAGASGATGSKGSQLTLQMNVYVAPVAPATPAATPSPAPTSSSTP
jgi:hypothetical protein